MSEGVHNCLIPKPLRGATHWYTTHTYCETQKFFTFLFDVSQSYCYGVLNENCIICYTIGTGGNAH
jgi:hypothetical protein